MSVSKIYKGTNGWTGETTFPGSESEYTWKITTVKQSSGKIASYATAWQYEDGSLVWDMFMAPKIELGEVSGSATEKAVKAEHYKAVAIFEQMQDAGEVPEREAPKSDSDFSANNFGITESEGDGDSHIGDAWKKNLNEPAKDPNEKPLGKVDKDFFIEHQNKIRGAVKDNAQLSKGYEFVIASTNNGLSWDEYKEDEFTRKMINAFFRDVEPFLKQKKPYLFEEENTGYTGQRWEGSAYKRTKSLGITEIAKLAREEFAAIFPEMKWSVRIDRFANGQSINAIGTNYPNNPYTKEYLKQISEGKTKSEISESNWRYKNAGGSEMFVEVYNEQFEKDKKKAERVLGQYRYSDSDGMIDYFSTNFYDHTKIELDDWEQRLFANDPEVKRSKEFWEKVAEDKKKGSEAAKAKIKDLGIIPKYVIIEYTSYWRGLDKDVTVPGIITKSPNGRSRWSLNYNIKLIPPTHPKANYRYKSALDGISLTSVKVDESAARLTLAQYRDKVQAIYGLKDPEYLIKKYGKAIEKAWKWARENAGITEAPKPKKKPSQPDKKPAAKAPAKPSTPIDETDLFEIVKGVHTKHGYEIFTAKIKTKVDRDKFNELRQRAKDGGGYYSSYRGNGATPGFIFKEEREALKFAGKTASADAKNDDLVFRYLLTQRPPSIGTHPIDNIIGEPKEITFGRKTAYILKYSAPLTQKEIDRFELVRKYDEKLIGKTFYRPFGKGYLALKVTGVSLSKDIISVEETLSTHVDARKSNKSYRGWQKLINNPAVNWSTEKPEDYKETWKHQTKPTPDTEKERARALAIAMAMKYKYQ